SAPNVATSLPNRLSLPGKTVRRGHSYAGFQFSFFNFHFSIFNVLLLEVFMIKKIRGTHDILPARFTEKLDAQIERWDLVERTAREVFRRYGFEEIRTPIIEKTELFERGIGTETDVNKEMYTFDDHGERVS